MSAEILNDTPISGEYPEKHFGEHFNSTLWVKFQDNNLNEWVGCFERPFQTLDKVLLDRKNETALIIAGGKGFLVDVQSKEKLHEMDELPPIDSAICTENPDMFLVGASYDIYIFEKTRLSNKIRPNFTIDGIYFIEQHGEKAIGHLYSYQFGDLNVGFEFDLKTYQIEINENLKFRYVEPYQFEQVS